MSRKGEGSRRQGEQRRRGESWSSGAPFPHGPPHTDTDLRPHTSTELSQRSTDPFPTQHRVYASLEDVPTWARNRQIHPAPQYQSATPYQLHPITGLPMRTSQAGPSSLNHRSAAYRPSRPRDNPRRPPSPAEASVAILPGADYVRSTTPRLPPFGSEARGAPIAGSDSTRTVRAPPHEAYVVCRAHGGGEETETFYSSGGMRSSRSSRRSQASESDDWRFSLEIVQEPTRGKALGREPLKKSTASLSTPLILRLVVRDRSGAEIAAGHSTLARRLGHLAVSVDLCSPDGREDRTTISFKRPTQPPRFSAGKLAIPFDTPTSSLVTGTSLVKGAQTYSRRSERGIAVRTNFFVFPDLIVRPAGTFALKARLSSVASGSYNRTSTGITPILDTVLTRPFTVTDFWDGPLAATELMVELTNQGERYLGVRAQSVGEGDEDEGGDSDWEGVER